MSTSDNDQVERAIAGCYDNWEDYYYDNYYSAAAPYPPVHADLVRDALIEGGVTTLLDLGCGPASFLRHIADTDITWHGFDLTLEMVEESRKVVADMDRKGSQVWVGSVLDNQSFHAPGEPAEFDGAVMIGVLPHVPEGQDEAVLQRMCASVTPGGVLVAEARNALFGLFTLNRPSFDLVTNDLIDWVSLESKATPSEALSLESVRVALAAHFRMDLPPIRGGKQGEQGYDEVLARMHVPFELAEAARRAGWVDVELRYAHFHALPPMYEKVVPAAFLAASLAMEDPRDWRGMVMASTVTVVGRRPS
jgi:SAM-dependent methyltransferase